MQGFLCAAVLLEHDSPHSDPWDTKLVLFDASRRHHSDTMLSDLGQLFSSALSVLSSTQLHWAHVERAQAFFPNSCSHCFL